VGAELVSYASAMLAPSNVGFGVRSIEWLRNNGGAWLVSDIERVYYSLNAPEKGGPPLKALPKVGLQSGGAESLYAPPPIAPVVDPPLPGEGKWRRAGPLVNGVPPVLVTTFRSDPNYPKMVAGVAWLDRSRTSLQLYPGRYEPPDGSFRGPMEVPPQLRGQLLATFNSGFKLEDSGGGFVALGHVYAPLRDGLATLVGVRDGGVDVRAWTGGPQPGPSVLFARQNLPLILENGQLNPNLSDGSLWGATLGNAIRVWRSGLGVDARGDLLYAAADNQTAESLALILQHAGALRAMELDINSEWVTFNFYGAPGASDPSKLLPGMSREATRYLEPDDRDFFAVFARGSSQAEQPGSGEAGRAGSGEAGRAGSGEAGRAGSGEAGRAGSGEVEHP
jgi:Phosphodiester glycosidase